MRRAVISIIVAAVLVAAVPASAAVRTAVPSTVQTSVTFTGTPAEIQAVLDAVNGTTATVDPTPTPTTTTTVAARPEHYNSGNFGELVTTIPVATSTALSAKQVIFSIPIGDVTAGDLIEVAAEFEVTNDLGYNCFLGSQIILTDSPTSTSGTEITEANGFNVTANMHHGTANRVGTLDVPNSAAARYVNLVAYSSSTLATPTSTLRVEQDYGRLSVLIWR